MTDKSEQVTSFREYLQEVKAREKSATLREYTSRILFQEIVRDALDGLIEEGFLIREGLITISADREKIEGFEKPDFLVAKEDILFQLYLIPNEERGIIKRNFFRGIFDVIQADPKITALVVIWDYDELPSCALDAFIMRKYLEIQENNINLGNEKISGMNECIKDFYNSQFVDWSIPDDFMIEREGEEISFALKDVLRRYLVKESNKLRDRSLKVLEKKKAKESVLKIDMNKILDKLTELLAKPELVADDRDKLESFLNRILKKTKSKDD